MLMWGKCLFKQYELCTSLTSPTRLQQGPLVIFQTNKRIKWAIFFFQYIKISRTTRAFTQDLAHNLNPTDMMVIPRSWKWKRFLALIPTLNLHSFSMTQCLYSLQLWGNQVNGCSHNTPREQCHECAVEDNRMVTKRNGAVNRFDNQSIVCYSIYAPGSAPYFYWPISARDE